VTNNLLETRNGYEKIDAVHKDEVAAPKRKEQRWR
jgi:hypothetical protein